MHNTKQLIKKALKKQIAKARKEVKEGKVYSQDAVLEMFGLKKDSQFDK